MANKSQSKNIPTLTGAEIVWATLVGEGVSTVFGYPGGAILPTYDALRKFPIHHVLVRHEQGAAHMADGYARASGRVGVAVATSGPGATNLVTGIATAMLDSVPIVCITGQVSSKVLGTDAFQEIDITGITLPITKHNFLVRRAGRHRPRHPRRLPDRRLRPSRPGPRRHHEGRAAGLRALRLRRRRARRASPASHAARRIQLHPAGRRTHLRGQASSHPRRPRRPHLRGRVPAPRLRRAPPDPRRQHSARPRRPSPPAIRSPSA